MATPVVQISPVDASLAAATNFTSFTEYLITGTTYILDSVAQIVYEFVPLSGVLNATGGSWAQFQSFLALNPVTSTQAPPALPTLTASATTSNASLFTPVSSVGLLAPNITTVTTGEAAIVAQLQRVVSLLQGSYMASLASVMQVSQLNPGLAAVDERDFAPTVQTGTYQ